MLFVHVYTFYKLHKIQILNKLQFCKQNLSLKKKQIEKSYNGFFIIKEIYVTFIFYTYSLSQPRHCYIYIYTSLAQYGIHKISKFTGSQLIMDNSSDVGKRTPLASLPCYLGMLFSIYIYTYISTLEHIFTEC